MPEETRPRRPPPRLGSGAAQALREVLARHEIGDRACEQTDFSADPYVWLIGQSSVLGRAANGMVEKAKAMLVDFMAELAAMAAETDPVLRLQRASRCEDLRRWAFEAYYPSMEPWINVRSLWTVVVRRMDADATDVARLLPDECPYKLVDLVGNVLDVGRLADVISPPTERGR